MDITFHEVVFFFSPSQPYFQGKKRCEREDVALALPLTIPPFLFYVDGFHSQEKTEQLIVQKEKDPMATTQKKVWLKDYTHVFLRRK